MKIMHKQGKQMPANRFDLNGSATDDVEAYRSHISTTESVSTPS